MKLEAKQLLHKLFQLFITLWLTVSAVFLLSCILPNANSPKGFSEIDASVYGASGASTVARVRSEYLQKKGLNLPLFYVSFPLRGHYLAEELAPPSFHEPWVKEAVLRHGLMETKAFLASILPWFKLASPSDQSRVLKALYLWAEKKEEEEILIHHKEIANLFGTIPSTSALLGQWNQLKEQSAPLTYNFSSVQWHGTNSLYHLWLQDIVRGNLGVSVLDYRPVTEKVGEALWYTGSIAFLGLFIGLPLSILLGLYFSQYRKNMLTRVAKQGLYLLDSIPAFLISLFLLGSYLYLGGTLSFQWQQTGESNRVIQSLQDPATYMAGLCVALLMVPHLALQFHRSLVEQNQQLYLRTAVAKGLSSGRVLFKHALPNALVPFITLMSEVVIGLMAGVVVTEITFSLPGIGSLFAKSILSADYPVMVGLTLFLLTFRLLVVWITDIAYLVVNPKLRNTRT